MVPKKHRRETQSVSAELSKSEESYGKKMREFNRFAPSYDGNPKKVFEWCEKTRSTPG